MGKYEKTTLDIRDNGVYACINHNSLTTKADVVKLIQKYGIQEVDYIALESALRERSDEVCISTNLNIISRNESIDIDFSDNKMTGYITFREPIYKGKLLTADDILQMLPANGMKYGIDKEKIAYLVENKEYDTKYDIAHGLEPKAGTDGYVEYFFATEKKKPKPKELEDGSVDYRDIDMFETAREKQVLAVQHPAIPGEDGMTVAGRVYPAERAKKAPALPKGKNTSVLEDGVTLVADISGRIFYMDGRVSILPILEITGDVDSSTGNIDFIGSVSISGGVKAGFSVVAGANIEIAGSVEASSIKAAGDIMITRGVQGGQKGTIEAGGSIYASFIENCTVSARQDITASSIMHSHIKCGGTVTLQGRKGLLVGGKSVVGDKVSANVIGSYMNTATEIDVGINPDMLDGYNTAVAEINKYLKEYDKLEKITDALSKVEAAKLSADKKKILVDSLRTKIVYKSKINEIQKKIDDFKMNMDSRKGVVEANTVHNGVKVTINNAVMYVKDDLTNVKLYNKEGKVQIGIK